MPTELQASVLGREYTLSLPEKPMGYWVVFLRLLMGWWFLHEGLTKYIGPGEFTAGWFLETQNTIVSPVLNLFAGGASEAVVTAVIPLGEVLIGMGLMAGCLVRLAAGFGAFMMFFFYFGNEAWRRGFVNGDLLGLVVFCTLILVGAGRVWGIDAYLEDTAVVRSHPWLRYLLG